DTDATGEIRLEITIEASPETVYSFLTQQQYLASWFADVVEAAARPGGRLRGSGALGTIEGTYLETVPFQKVVFTWGGVQGLASGQTIVEFLLEPKGSGTLLKLHHHKLPKPVVNIHEQVWAHGGLVKLKGAAEGHPPRLTCMSDGSAHSGS